MTNLLVTSRIRLCVGVRMEAGDRAWRCGMVDGVDPPIRFAVVHESARTRVTRLSRADRTLIMKEPLGPDAACRLQHESAILERLRGAAGVAQLADEAPHEGTIVLTDAGAGTLVDLPK